MSELKVRTAYSIAMEEEDLESSGTTLVYLKSEADRVIAEKDAEIARLKAIRKVHIESIESICEGLKLDAKQICKTQRALWLARAERARDNSILLPSKFMRNVWENVERKCRAKAEEYK